MRYIELAFDEVEAETDMAILFELGEDKPVWIPKSAIDMNEYDMDCNFVPVAEWFAEREGLI